MEVKGSLFLVAGGASGLGEATVRLLVEKGAKAVILDQNEVSGFTIQEEYGDQVLFKKADVTSEAEVKSVLAEAVERFGPLHGIVNTAGVAIAEKVIGREGVHDLERFNKVLQVNLVGSFNTACLAAEFMKDNEPNEQGERGVIINTASVAAFEGQIGQAAYSASKGGIVAMMLPMARELARYGIRVMTVAPGLFDTPMFDTLPEEAKTALGKMTPFPQRLGYPEEYAFLVRQIIENPMLNGEVIRLDGGIRMQPK